MHLPTEKLGEYAGADVNFALALNSITHTHHALIRADHTGILVILVLFVPFRIYNSTYAEEGER